MSKAIKEAHKKQAEANMLGALNRASSITVGTCFGGTTEVMMRASNGSVLWCPMQPVEVIELIHQLAANVGCHIALRPRQDFSSWRDWKIDETMYAGNGWPPFVNDMAPHKDKGQVLPPPEQQPGLNIKKEQSHEAVATQAPVKRRSTKRTSASA